MTYKTFSEGDKVRLVKDDVGLGVIPVGSICTVTSAVPEFDLYFVDDQKGVSWQYKSSELEKVE